MAGAAVDARRWADRLIRELPDAWRDDLARVPRDAVEAHFPLKTRPFPAGQTLRERGARGPCDGVSYLESGLVLYVPTLQDDIRRENFTILHELGHHLIAQSPDATDWVQDQQDPARVEEELADAIAAALLLPPSTLDGVLGESGHPSADALHTLYDVSSASAQVCAIALARRLGCEGFIALIDAVTGTVSFAARNADTRPYAWCGDLVPDGHPLRLLAPTQAFRGVTWWPWPNGEHADYFVDARRGRKRTVAVFATQNWWGVPGVHVLDRGEEEGRRRPESGRFRCPLCRAERWTRGFPCNDCRQPYCATCGRCACDRQRQDASGLCVRCRVRWRPALLDENGLCSTCRPPRRPPAPAR